MILLAVPIVDRSCSFNGDFRQFSKSENPTNFGIGRPNSLIANNLPNIAFLFPNRFICESTNFPGSNRFKWTYPASVAERRILLPLSVLTTTRECPGSSSGISRYQGSPQDRSANSPVPSGQRWHRYGQYL